jgi:hypothetical protein
MSGSTNLLIASSGPSGPVFHPVYSLDGLGANDPPVITLNLTGAELFKDFTYTVPDDGNQHRWLYATMCIAPFMTNVTALDYEGVTDLLPFNTLATAGPIGGLAFYSQGGIGAMTGSNFRFTRAAAVDGAITVYLRIYTFGDVGFANVFSVENNIDIVSDPTPTVTDTFNDAFFGDCLFTLGSRNNWVPGRNFSVTNPLTYTYSPTGSAGVGVLDNGVSQALALEFQVLHAQEPHPSATWTFTSPQPGEIGAIAINSLSGITY